MHEEMLQEGLRETKLLFVMVAGDFNLPFSERGARDVIPA